MENVNEVVVEPELLEENDFTPEELADDNTDWKAKAQELKGLNKRRATKLGKLKEAHEALVKANEKPPVPQLNPDKPEKKGFDYAELAFLTARGISDEDTEYVWEQSKKTGKELKELVGAKWFQAELQERKEERATKEAVPGGSNRPGSPAKDSVDYWTAQIDAGKAKLFDISDVELRRKVNNARIKTAAQSTHFSSQPVIGG